MTIPKSNMDPLTTLEEVSTLMASSKNEAEWNENADKVKKANKGYPNFWFTTIVLSGLTAKTMSTWK